MKTICVYCGSSLGNDPAYAQAAQQLGELLTQRDITLVYGGGKTGLMGVVANAVLHSGGRVIGVIPQALKSKEIAHDGLTELHIVKDMHERKALMMTLSDGFIAMPGGFGTYDEYFEALTWAQLGYHQKPCGLLNVAGFYTPFLAYADHTVAGGFVQAQHRALILDETDPARLLDRLLAYRPIITSKWRAR